MWNNEGGGPEAADAETGASAPGYKRRCGKNRPRPLFLGLLMVLLAGCQSDPFARPALPTLNNPNPQHIRLTFPQSLPDEFTSDDTIVLQFPFNIQFAMLGVLNVNRPANTFEFYALNKTGLAYFHLSGDHGNLSVKDALGPWMEHKDILLSIGQDIQNIYITPSPEPGAHVTIKPTIVRFDQKSPGGYLIYDFGGQPIALLQKELDGFFGPAWTARYYDYQANDKGKLFPRGIVLDNSRFFYRLIIKNRDWSTDEQP